MTTNFEVEIFNDSIYITDDYGEIVSWISEEWIEEPDVAMVIANAVKFLYTDGAIALRKTLGNTASVPQEVLDDPEA